MERRVKVILVFNALVHFQKEENQHNSDNTTVVAYINKQWGTHSASLCYLAWEMLNWCKQRNFRLMAVFMWGEMNV